MVLVVVVVQILVLTNMFCPRLPGTDYLAQTTWYRAGNPRNTATCGLDCFPVLLIVDI